MSKFKININELDECNNKLNRAKNLIESVTKDGDTLFTNLKDSWDGAAADAFAGSFSRQNTKIKNSTTVIDALIQKNNDIKTDIIQTDSATKHTDFTKISTKPDWYKW